jgi:hypothetical protein
MTKEREKTANDKQLVELNVDFLANQLEQYHQTWLEKLMTQKVEYLHRTTRTSENVIYFIYTYNVYFEKAIYQVMTTHEDIYCVRKLYSQVEKNGDSIITYQQVKGNQIVEDPRILSSIKTLLNA